MSNLFQTLETGKLGLFAGQRALETISRNVANATNENYSRQRVVQHANISPSMTYSYGGYGVIISEVEQIRDRFLEERFTSEQSFLYEWEEKESTLTSLEAMINEPSESSFQNAFSEFWESWQNVNKYPQDIALRENLIDSADHVSSLFQNIDKRLVQLQENKNGQIEEQVKEVNEALRKIADLNQKIVGSEASGQKANDLRDTRLAEVNKLAKMIDVKYSINSNGSMYVYSSGKMLVQDAQVVENIQAKRVAENGQSVVKVYYGNSGTELNPQSGRIRGILDSRDSIIPEFIEKFDDLASDFIYAVNQQHSQGFGLEAFQEIIGTYQFNNLDANLGIVNNGLPYDIENGSFDLTLINSNGEKEVHTINVLDGQVNTVGDLMREINSLSHIQASLTSNLELKISSSDGYEFFVSNDSSGLLSAIGANTFFSGSNAGDIDVNYLVRQNAANIAISEDGTPGSNGNGTKIANIPTLNKAQGSSMTLDASLSLTVSSIGLQVQQASRNVEIQQNVVDDTMQARQSVSGVSLNEEAIDMIKYQQAYQAAAKIIQVADEMLEILVTQLG